MKELSEKKEQIESDLLKISNYFSEEEGLMNLEDDLINLNWSKGEIFDFLAFEFNVFLDYKEYPDIRTVKQVLDLIKKVTPKQQ